MLVLYVGFRQSFSILLGQMPKNPLISTHYPPPPPPPPPIQYWEPYFIMFRSYLYSNSETNIDWGGGRGRGGMLLEKISIYGIMIQNRRL